jgi:hypothetical protein
MLHQKYEHQSHINSKKLFKEKVHPQYLQNFKDLS